MFTQLQITLPNSQNFNLLICQVNQVVLSKFLFSAVVISQILTLFCHCYAEVPFLKRNNLNSIKIVFIQIFYLSRSNPVFRRNNCCQQMLSIFEIQNILSIFTIENNKRIRLYIFHPITTPTNTFIWTRFRTGSIIFK